jgi:putative methionine-R-sulfoxide reductase with GAF domain
MHFMDSRTLLSELRILATQNAARLDALQQIADLIRSTGHYRWVGLYDVNHETAMVSNVVYSGARAPEYPTFPITKGLTGAAIKTLRTINVGDVSSDSRYLTAFGSTQSEIIVPILDRTEGRVIGTIDIESEHGNAFDGETERLLEECSKQISSLWRVE